MQYKYIVLLNTTIGAFMALLDSNIVLVSLPTVIRDLPGTSSEIGIWVIMGYTLVTATLLLTIGRLGDIFGRVKLYNMGFAVFTIGSGLCSISPNGLSLVVFRLVQGVGAAFIFANNAAILTDAFPVAERGRAIGLNTVAITAGSVVGLAAGGILTALLGWRSIFWINLPIGVFGTIWAFTKLKETGVISKGEKLDPLGNGLFASGLSISLLGLTLGAVYGWSLIYVVAMVAGILLLASFGYLETRLRYPMMDLNLFRNRAFSAAMLSNLLSSISRGGFGLVLVFFFQGVLHLGALTAGVMLMPFSIAFVCFGPLSGALSDRHGARGLSSGGLIVSAFSLLWFSTLPSTVPYSVLVIPLILSGIGGGMFVAPNMASIMNSVPMERRGVASGMSSTLVNSGFLLSQGLSFAIMATGVPLSALQNIFAGLPIQSDLVDINLFLDAMHKIFLTMAIMSAVAAVSSLMRGPKAAAEGKPKKSS